MNNNDASELMAKLLDAMRERDEAFVMEHHLPASVLFLLRKAAAISEELSSLERLVERKGEEEKLVEQALQAELERVLP